MPPGTQMRSRRGQFSKVCVGTRPRPLSLGTGAADFATMCIADSGRRARTCCGPVQSSCVMCEDDKADIERRHVRPPCLNGRSELRGRGGNQAGECAEGRLRPTAHGAQTRSALSMEAAMRVRTGLGFFMSTPPKLKSWIIEPVGYLLPAQHTSTPPYCAVGEPIPQRYRRIRGRTRTTSESRMALQVLGCDANV